MCAVPTASGGVSAPAPSGSRPSAGTRDGDGSRAGGEDRIGASGRARRAAARLTAFMPAARRRAGAGEPHLLVRYAIAVACTLAATVLTILLWQAVLHRNPFALFYAAVMLSAWYGGLGPGMLATAGSVLAIDTFLLPSFASLVPGS